MISEALLSKVLDTNCSNIEVVKDHIRYDYTGSGLIYGDDFIHIDDLTDKCKKWLYEKGVVNFDPNASYEQIVKLCDCYIEPQSAV